VSQENVDLVRRLNEAYNAGDMDAWSDLLAPNVIWRVMPDWPEQGPFIGRDAVLLQVRQLGEAWDSDAIVPVGDYIDAGDQVVLRYIWRGVGRGPELNMELTCIYTFREDTIIGFEFFWDHAEALKAVGFEE
jgi:ketosteroid isomerase-like protein